VHQRQYRMRAVDHTQNVKAGAH